MTIRRLNFTDRLIASVQEGAAVVSGHVDATRPLPVPHSTDTSSGPGAHTLSAQERRRSGALMRVNHVGEICAQALYQGQSLMARHPIVRAQFNDACREEKDHLAWTAQRLRELDARPSFLNPLWYAGSLVIGTLAGARGDRYSLGFMAETERQVERHLAGHMKSLSSTDLRSRTIVAKMKQEEAQHAATATQMGAIRPSWPIQRLMQTVARVMTTVSYRI